MQAPITNIVLFCIHLIGILREACFSISLHAALLVSSHCILHRCHSQVWDMSDLGAFSQYGAATVNQKATPINLLVQKIPLKQIWKYV